MHILSNIIFHKIFKTTVYSTIALTFCAWVVQSSKYMHYISKSNIGIAKFIEFASYLSIDIISIILPIALSISTAFVFQRLIDSKQIIAMQASGFSKLFPLKASVLISLLTTLFLYITDIYISPIAWSNFWNMEVKFKNNINPIKNSGEIFSKNGFSIYASEYIGDICFKNIIIIDSRKLERTYTYRAHSGFIKNGTIYLQDGEIVEINKTNMKYSISKFKTYTYSIDIILSGANNEKKYNELPFLELINIKDNEAKSLLHQKLSSPLRGILFPLMAVFFILLAPYKRKKTYGRMSILISLIFIIQGICFWLYNISAKNPSFLYYPYYFLGFCTMFFLISIFMKGKEI